MAESVFRKKSMDRVASPEALNDYVRVANPSVWVVLVAIIVLLVGVCVWGVLGHLDTKMNVAAIHSQNQTTCYIPEDKIEQIAVGMKVTVNGVEGSVLGISAKPVQVADLDAYLIHKVGLENGQWVYEVLCDVNLADGSYEAQVVTESVSPMSFVMN